MIYRRVKPPGRLLLVRASPLAVAALVKFARAATPLSATKVGEGSLGGRALGFQDSEWDDRECQLRDDTASPGIVRQYAGASRVRLPIGGSPVHVRVVSPSTPRGCFFQHVVMSGRGDHLFLWARDPCGTHPSFIFTNNLEIVARSRVRYYFFWCPVARLEKGNV